MALKDIKVVAYSALPYKSHERHTLIQLLNNLDQYQHALGRHFSDEENG
jgi:hypothetical protein